MTSRFPKAFMRALFIAPWVLASPLLLGGRGCGESVPVGGCDESACGPRSAAPMITCWDGSIGGNTGICTGADGTCRWEIRDCPAPGDAGVGDAGPGDAGPGDAGRDFSRCTETVITAGDTEQDHGSLSYFGSWMHLSHPADVAARLYLEAIARASPSERTSAGGGWLAPFGYPWEGTGDHLEPVGFEYGASVDRPLYAPDEDLFLYPTGWTFRVRVCLEPARDPYPTCGAGFDCEVTAARGVRVDGSDQYACMCTPPCGSDDHCPIPHTGNAMAACGPNYECVLRCSETSRCPDGQICVPYDWPLEPPGAAYCMVPSGS